MIVLDGKGEEVEEVEVTSLQVDVVQSVQEVDRCRLDPRSEGCRHRSIGPSLQENYLMSV